MEIKDKTQFKLLSISLVESNFVRDIEFKTEETELPQSINIKNNFVEQNNHLYVTLIVDIKVEDSKKTLISFIVKMIGEFECIEIPELSINDFANINAPAIIFPFIREHVASVSIKAGIPPILLPPVNFVKLNQKQNTESK